MTQRVMKWCCMFNLLLYNIQQQKLRLMRRLQQRRYLTSARQIKREEANNRFRRYETRPTMLWAT